MDCSKPFCTRGDELFRDGTTEDVIHELEGFTFVFFQPFCVSRSDLDLDIRKFTTTTGLFLEYLTVFNVLVSASL